jgi:hypothetical protein
MNNSSLPSRSLRCFPNIPLCSASLFSSGHNFTEPELPDRTCCAPRVSLTSQRRRFRVRAAFFAAAERDRAERCLATRFACLDNARLDAERRLSRLSARFVARDRFREGPFAAPGAALCEIALCLALCSLPAAFWRRQFYSGPPRLGQTNGDRLLGRSGTVFAFPNVFHFFAHKLSRLSGRRFPFTFVLARTFDCFFFWHNKMVSPLATRLDVTKRRNIRATKAVALREEGNDDSYSRIIAN